MTTPQTPYAPYQQPTPQTPLQRIQYAHSRRATTDYIFNFWTAFGWTVLSCGYFGYYVIYRLTERSREHNKRRLEELEAANELAWQRANQQGKAEELRPNFERIAAHLNVLRQQTIEFRDPVIWLVICAVSGGIGTLVLYVFLDQDLVKHDPAEGAVESELSHIFTQLGAKISQPNPARMKGPHNYTGRIVATIFSCGIYGIWWLYDLENEGNRHFMHNWPWEDELLQAATSLEA